MMTEKTSGTAFAPFKHRVFTVIWIATLISNIGTWVFNVSSGWLMTELAPSAFMVSLVQVATALPIFLFALPAGALGDIFDRRKLLLITQWASAIAFFIFAGMLWADVNSAWILLFFTFLSGAGAAFATPAWQAIVPKMVPKEDLPAAIALNGVSINIARAIGPALGGFLLTAAGAMVTIAANAASYLVVVAALLWWRTQTTQAAVLPREHMVGAMQAGVRFALRSKPLVNTMIRALAFFVFASAYWALLPLVAKDLLQGDSGLYGILLTALGGGAIMGTFLMSRLKRYLNPNQMTAVGTLGTAIGMVLFAIGGTSQAGIIAGGLCGIAWIMVLSSLNVSAQVALPDWVRARGLAIFQMTFFGAMTAGSLMWGQLAGQVGLANTLLIAAGVSVVAIAVTWKFKLNLGENHDYAPSGHWPEPLLVTSVSHDHGPVLVTLEYDIPSENRDAFQTVIHELGIIRRRDGAVQWGFFEDVEKHGRFIEMFTVESWVAHLRQHARVSTADKAIQDKVNALHRGGKPRVTHAVTPRKGETIETLPHNHHD